MAIVSDPVFWLILAGLGAGAAFLPFAMKRWRRAQALLDELPIDHFDPGGGEHREMPEIEPDVEAEAELDREEPSSEGSELAGIRQALDKLNRAQEVRLDRLEARLAAIEERLGAGKA